jgi:hypothetical protein
VRTQGEEVWLCFATNLYILSTPPLAKASLAKHPLVAVCA